MPKNAPPAPHLVVGLGASAGGVEALESFFSALPKVDGIAFVVVLHLAPDEESRLADVLAGSLPLPVVQVKKRVRLAQGHVYVIPPDRNLLVEDGHLVLEPIERERVRRRPIDHFFRTLAEAWSERAVAVVLSGLGANGTVGARRIRETGGAVLVQTPEDAAYEEMPRTAISEDIADFIGTTGELAREVVAYAERLHEAGLPDSPKERPEDGVRAVQSVLAQLRVRTGHDFAHYKRATVLRRLDRRLHVTGADSLTEYLDRLRNSTTEAEALLRDLLISVTNFFRDPAAFAALEAAIPSLFEGKASGDELRVWVAGCATGEEAYSVAMLLLEHAATLADPPAIQVFATDLSDDAVRTARAGTYPASIEADVSPERLQRFFANENGQYRVTETLRETVLFATHSLLKDPPFSRLDLVTCRNLLIYLQRSLQEQVLAVFHYALRRGGHLFLGTSESTDGASDLYDVVSKEARLFRRRSVETPAPLLPRVPPVLAEFPAIPEATPPASAALPEGPGGNGQPREPLETDVARLHTRLRDEIAPPSVLVNEANTVVHVAASASSFLRVGEGAPSRNLIKMLRPELRASVQTALFKSRREERETGVDPMEIDIEGETRRVRICARPARNGLSQVVFESAPAEPKAERPATEDERIAVLDAELHQTREQLQVTVEEFETSREELKAQNEELQSINEELRSTAEELETAKEEAQSMSEELRTVNDEIKGKVEELASAKGDLENLIASTEIATLFLDRRLRIKRFTPHVREHFHVLAADVGRPLADLAQKFGGVRLAEDAEAVIERLEVQEREIQGADGRWYLVQVRPYRTMEDRIDGVVITFVDITMRRENEEDLRQRAEEFRALIEASAQMVWTTNAEGRVVEDSPTWRAFTGQSVEEWLGEGWSNAIHPDDRARMVAHWRESVAAGEPFEEEFWGHHGPSRSWRRMAVRAVPLHDPAGELRGYVGMNTDVTERREAEQRLRHSEERMRLALDAAQMGSFVWHPDEDRAESDVQMLAHFGLPPESTLSLAGALARLIHPDDGERYADAVARSLDPDGAGRLQEEIRVLRPDGETRRLEIIGRVEFSGIPPEPVRMIGTATDVTEVREAERARHESEERLRRIAETVPDVLFTTTATGEVTYVNPRFETLTGWPTSAALHTTLWPDLVHPDDREATVAAWRTSQKEEASFEMRHRLLTADGESCWVLTRAHPIRDDEGTVATWYGTVTDIDKLAQAEAEVRELNATLEARVRARTAQVRRLSSRLASAEQAERRRIAQILHDDLQQRLAGLGMTLDLLGEAAPDGAALHEKSRETLNGAINLTRTLSVELSPPILRNGDLDETLQWLVRHMEEHHGMTIDLDIGAPPHDFNEETLGLIYQSLRELLFNVVKHAGTRHATLRVRSEAERVVVTVKDGGKGFAAAALSASDSPGFGLFSVRERLEAIGGSLDVESEPGEGTEVALRVPLGQKTVAA